MKCSVSHPNIAPHIKQSILAYQEEGMLHKFYTSYYQHKKYPFSNILIRLFPGLAKEFRRRNIDDVEYEFLKGSPLPELVRVFAARFLNPMVSNRIWQRNELQFDRWVAANLNGRIQWVHTYEHAALATIRKARSLKIPSFYEQPSQHHTYLSELLQAELIKYPELNGKASELMHDRMAKRCERRKDQELKECDFIICNSTFTLNTLTNAGIDREKIILIPLGFPPAEEHKREKLNTEKLSFLFAGNQNIRKGLHILYEAWQNCNFDPLKAELLIIGKNHLPASLRKGLPPSIKFIPNLLQEELNEYYRKAHVFVLPTLADGFGMVISEAMAKGLAVIATMNSGGPDIIRHGHNGLLIQAGDADVLASQLRWCFEHPENLIEIGKNALDTAKAYPWSQYRQRLRAEVLSRVNGYQALNNLSTS